jgi:uncharacterized protein YjdB
MAGEILSGYNGYTIQTTGDTPTVDGEVRKVIIAIKYPIYANDVDFTISTNASHWAVQAPDGTIIPVINPTVLFVNRDSSIVQFDMASGCQYPFNAPVVLMYRSTNAQIRITERSTNRPFTPNTLSGSIGFTIDKANKTITADGEVNTFMVAIWYPRREGGVEFTISTDPGHWAVHFGNNHLITLKDPKVVSITKEHSLVEFTMDDYYPSNVPGILIYRTNAAWISINDAPIPFMPVTDIIGIPTSIKVGIPINLGMIASVEPMGATRQWIKYIVTNAGTTGAVVANDVLTVSATGNLQLRAYVEQGISDTEDFIKNITISATGTSITINTQPISYAEAYAGAASERLETDATAPGINLNYLWYSNTTNTNVGGTALVGQTNKVYNVPNTLASGDYYFFCEIKGTGAITTRTEVSHIKMFTKVTGITLSPKTGTMIATDPNFIQLTATIVPSGADDKKVLWSSNDIDVVAVDDTGKVYGQGISGNATITAKTNDGWFTDTASITITPFNPVTDIDGLPSELTLGQTLTLNGTVNPSNASFKNITWSIIEANTTGAIITNGNQLTAIATGQIILNAHVNNGIIYGSHYDEEFSIGVVEAFRPVTNITNVPATITIADDEMTPIDGTVVPTNASADDIVWSIAPNGDPDLTEAVVVDNNISAKKSGSVTLRATIVSGKSISEDFVKDFTIQINHIKLVTEITIDNTKIEVSDIINLDNISEIFPSDAANKTISWSVEEANTTGASIVNNILTFTDVGEVIIRATVDQGIYDNYSTLFSLNIEPDFIPVTDIDIQPLSLMNFVSTNITLDITPDNATNYSDIYFSELSFKDDVPMDALGCQITKINDTTYSYIFIIIDDNKGEEWPVSLDQISINQNIDVVNAVDIGTNFSKNVTFIVQRYINVEDIKRNFNQLIPPNSQVDLSQVELIPSDATNKTIMWEIHDDSGTNATLIDGNKLEVVDIGEVLLSAKVYKGDTENYYEKTIRIWVASGPVTNVTGVPSQLTCPTGVNEEVTVPFTTVPANSRHALIWNVVGNDNVIVVNHGSEINRTISIMNPLPNGTLQPGTIEIEATAVDINENTPNVFRFQIQLV